MSDSSRSSQRRDKRRDARRVARRGNMSGWKRLVAIRRLNALRTANRSDSSHAQRGHSAQHGRTRDFFLRHPETRGPKGMRFLSFLVALALIFIVGRHYVLQRIDPNNIVQNQLVPALEKQLGKKVEIGRVQTDYLDRVIIDDIVVGRDPNSPIGALLKIGRVGAQIDFIRAALNSSDPLVALKSVTLSNPQLDLQRDSKGRLNLLELVKKDSEGPSLQWNGTLFIEDGRIVFTDQTIRSRGQNLRVDARKIGGQVALNGARPTTYQLNLPATYFPGESEPIRNITTNGEIASDAKWALANLNLPSAPLPLLANWGDPNGQVVVSGGTLGTKVQIGYDAAVAPAEQWLARGDLTLRDARGYSRALLEPNTKTPLKIEDLDAQLGFDNRSITIRSLQVLAASSTLTARGAVAFPQPLWPRKANQKLNPILDVTLGSDNLNTPRFLTWLPPNLARQYRVVTGRSKIAARVRGDANTPRISGVLSAPATQIAARDLKLQMGALRSQFDVRLQAPNSQLRGGRGTIEIQTPLLQVLAANNNLRGQSLNSGWDFSFAQTANQKWNGSAQGKWAVQQMRANANGIDAQLQNLSGKSDGTINGQALQARLTMNSGTTVVSGNALGRARMSKLQSALWFDGALRQNLSGRLGGAFIGDNFSAAKAGVGSASTPGLQVSFGATNFALAQNGPQIRGLQGTLNSRNLALSATDLGSANIASAQSGFNAQSVSPGANGPQISGLEGSVNWRALNARGPRLANMQTENGAAIFKVGALNGNLAQNLRLALRAGDFWLDTARAGRINGAAAQLSLQSERVRLANLGAAAWRGDASWRNVDGSRLQLAKLSPQAAQQIQNAGRSSGRAQFSGLVLNRVAQAVDVNSGAWWRALPQIRGEVTVNDATVADYRLDQARANFSLRDGILSLDANQISRDAGPLRAAFRADLRNGVRDVNALGARVDINVPNISVPASMANPYLRNLGLRAEGTLRGSLTVRNRAQALNAFDVAWNFSLPRGRITALDASRRAPERGQNFLLAGEHTFDVAAATISGSGLARLGANNAVSFAGNSSVNAERAAVFVRAPFGKGTGNGSATLPALPTWLSGTSVAGMQLLAQGEVRVARGQTPQADLSGALRIARTKLPILPSARGTSATQSATPPVIENVRVAFGDVNSQSTLVDLSRIEAQIAGGTIEGSARLQRDGLVAAQVLSSNVDLARVQNWLGDDLAAWTRGAQVANAPQNAGNKWPQLRGRAFARAQVSGRWPQLETDVQWRLLDGGLNGIFNGKNLDVPLDLARGEFSTQVPALRQIALRDVTLWSNSGRFWVDGEISRRDESFSPDALNVNLRTRANNFPLQLAALWPGVRQQIQQADVQGLMSAELEINGAALNPQVKGRTALRLGRVFGLSIEEITANISAVPAIGGPQVLASNISGQVEGAPVGGRLEADIGRNFWQLRFNARDVPSARLAQVADNVPDALRDKLDIPTERIGILPLRGRFSADIALTGTLFNENNRFVPMPVSGNASLETDALRWRGRPVGSVTADLALEDNMLQIAGIQLWRTSADAPARDLLAQAGAVEPPANDEGLNASLVRMSGTIPLQPNAPGLQVRLISEDAQVTTLVQTAEEIVAYLRERGGAQIEAQKSILESAQKNLAALPPDLTGRVALEARLTGSIATPDLEVERLVLRDASFRYEDSTQLLPTVDAAFNYRGAEKAVTIEKAEVILTEAVPEIVAPATAQTVAQGAVAIPQATKTEPITTVLRLEKGGRIELDGTVRINGELRDGNLRRLARYVPALRAIDGTPLAAGRIEKFDFAARGAIFSPTITGQLVAEDLKYQENTIDRLEVRTFRIGDGEFTIDQGDLQLVKGDFRSASAFVQIPWTWGGDGELPGPRPEAQIRIAVPIEESNFGALAGILVPALLKADADAFDGNVEIGGTLQAPKLSGRVHLENARFQFAPDALPFDAGLTRVSGTISFVDGNRLIIAPDDFLRGEITSASKIAANDTGNPKVDEKTKKPKVPKKKDDVELSGEFSMRGGAVFDLSAQVLAQPLQTLATHFYDLTFSMRNAKLGTRDFSGVRDANLGIIWKTRGNNARIGQRVRWMMTARDNVSKRAKTKAPINASSDGAIYSYGALDLRPDFPSGLEAIGKSQMQPLTDLTGFETLNVANRLAALLGQGTAPRAANAGDVTPTLSAPTSVVLRDARPQFNMARWNWTLRNFGRGVFNGQLIFDNARSTPIITPTRQTLARRLRESLPPKIAAPNLSESKTPEFSAHSETSASILSEINRDLDANLLDQADGWKIDSVKVTPPNTAQQSDDDLATLQPASEFSTGGIVTNTLSNDATWRAKIGATPLTAPVGRIRRVQDSTEDENDNSAELLRALSEAIPVRVSGEVALEDAQLAGTPPSGDAGPSFDLPAFPVLNLRAVVGPSVRIETPNLRSEVSGALEMAGTPYSPYIQGSFETRSGTIRFPNANARILNGEINVLVTRDAGTDRLRPNITIDATARGQAGAYQVTVSLRGPLDLGDSSTQNLRIDVSSNPPLSQDEAFAQLFGTRESGNLFGGSQSNQAYAQAVVSVISAPLFSGIERSLERALGLSSLTFEYRFNEASAIQLGKALGKRVYISYRRSLGGTRASATGVVGGTLIGDSLRIEYRLNGGVQIVYQLSRDQIDSLSASGIASLNARTRKTLSIEKTWRF